MHSGESFIALSPCSLTTSFSYKYDLVSMMINNLNYHGNKHMQMRKGKGESEDNLSTPEMCNGRAVDCGIITEFCISIVHGSHRLGLRRVLRVCHLCTNYYNLSM